MVAASVVLLETARRARAEALVHRSAEPPVCRADDGTELHVETAGPQASALTVVLVHGYGASSGEWRRQRDALAERAHVVLYDQRGHGRSGWGHHRRATLAQLGRDLLRVVDERGGDRPVVLVGHSMGGMAVLSLAASHPGLFGGRVVGVGLLSASAGRLMEAGVPGALARALRRTRALTPFLWVLWFTAPLLDRASPFATATARSRLRHRLFGRCAPQDRDLDQAQRDFVATRASVLAAFAPSLLHQDTTAALDALRGLPVLALAGEDDATIPASHSRRLGRELGSGCELLVVPGAGHMVNVTHPEPVNDALLRLLAAAGRS